MNPSFKQFLTEYEVKTNVCEVVYVNEDTGEIVSEKEFLEEGAQRAFKREGQKIKRYFRCTTGPKAGKLVSAASECVKRKNPKKVRLGRRIAKQKKGIRVMKTKIAKKKAISKVVTAMNKRISGK